MNAWNLNGKRALITGGSRGIGFETAKQFLNLGAELIIVSRDQDTLTEVIHKIGTEKLLTLSADISTNTGRIIISEVVEEKWGNLDILVNNAGTNIRKKTIEFSSDEIKKIFDTNLFGAFELTRLLYTPMKNTGNASVINVSSVAGIFDVGTGSPYGMTKAALIQLSRNLAGEWADDGIRVNTVSPWYTDTPLIQSVLEDENKKRQILNRTPLNRIATPDEVANVISFLAMNESSYLTGQNIVVDGGMSIKGL